MEYVEVHQPLSYVNKTWGGVCQGEGLIYWGGRDGDTRSLNFIESLKNADQCAIAPNFYPHLPKNLDIPLRMYALSRCPDLISISDALNQRSSGDARLHLCNHRHWADHISSVVIDLL